MNTLYFKKENGCIGIKQVKTKKFLRPRMNSVAWRKIVNTLAGTFSQKNVCIENKLMKIKERDQIKANKDYLKPSTISHGRQISIHGNPNSYLGT